MQTVSILNKQTVADIASDDNRYYKMPFLYLVSSYVRNQAMEWADKKYNYLEKKDTGSWVIYKFALR